MLYDVIDVINHVFVERAVPYYVARDYEHDERYKIVPCYGFPA